MKKQMPPKETMSTPTAPTMGPAAIGGTAGPVTAKAAPTDSRFAKSNPDNALPPAAFHSGRGMK